MRASSFISAIAVVQARWLAPLIFMPRDPHTSSRQERRNFRVDSISFLYRSAHPKPSARSGRNPREKHRFGDCCPYRDPSDRRENASRAMRPRAKGRFSRSGSLGLPAMRTAPLRGALAYQIPCARQIHAGGSLAGKECSDAISTMS